MLKFLLVFLSLTNVAFAGEPELTERDVAVAESFGVKKSALRREFLKARARTPAAELRGDVYKSFASEDPKAGLRRIDHVVDRIVRQTAAAMQAKGYKAESAEMMLQYETEYSFYFTGRVDLLGAGDIGDFAPWSEFLKNVHEKAHEFLGETLCKFLHVHDLFIITYAVPVVFAPSKYDLETYQNHFTGVHILGPLWDHYGLAPVAAYWTVEIVCSVGTWGMGLVSFACGPIASVSENVFGVYLSPRLGDAVWKRAQ